MRWFEAMNPLVYRRSFEAQEITTKYPPLLNCRNKQLVFELSSPSGSVHSGQLEVTQWQEIPLPESIERRSFRPNFELRRDYFSYDPTAEGAVEWYLNFAHSDLFCAYGGSLFAQDEMQVAEHPALASLRRAIIDSELSCKTVENGKATPILIMGVERRCSVSTEANSNEGRPYGLYGNNFARASEAAIRRATKVLHPPTLTNIIAMEAPYGNSQRYTRQQIHSILSTAYTGFRAAVLESRRSGGETTKAIVHTGYWGCGAYGGNRQLMPLVQMIAAIAAEVTSLVFHSGADDSGYDHACHMLADLLPIEVSVNVELLSTKLEEAGYMWGVSDGN